MIVNTVCLCCVTGASDTDFHFITCGLSNTYIDCLAVFILTVNTKDREIQSTLLFHAYPQIKGMTFDLQMI